jgi:mannosyl-3-phosphoglycerate phosphatase
MTATSSSFGGIVKHAAARAVAGRTPMLHHCAMLTASTPPRLFFPIVFSDLDGTLLDHETYSFDAARPGLDALNAHGIPLILASSKTRAEMQNLAPELGAAGLIFENGGGVEWPDNIEPSVSNAVESPDYASIRALLDVLTGGLRAKVNGFGDMSDSEVASMTGLPLEAARLARRREHSEPFLFSGSANELGEVEAAVTSAGWQLVRGGRFNTITGPNTKATRLEQMATAYAASQPAGTQVYTIALGDAPNDAAMIEAADRGFVIANPHGSPMPELAGEKVGRVTRSTLAGPAGWSESVAEALQEIDTFTDAGMTRG